MTQFTHIFFEVGVVNTDVLMLAHHIAGRTRQLDFDRAADDDREILLGELIVLRVVWIEVVLPIPGAARGNLGTDDQAEQDGFLDRLAVHDRQRTGQAEDDRVDLFVRLLAETPGRRREDLGARVQLDVHLEADDDFPFRGGTHSAACWWAKPWAASKRRPAAKSLASESGAPTRWKPTGRCPDLPQGTEIAGSPARLAGIVKISSK